MLALIDMEMGNLRSVREAFTRVGAKTVVARRPQDLEGAEAIVLPGVGAFGDGMASLRRHGLADALRARRGQPLLGICLGMHLLADVGEEHGWHEGLGLVPGRVVRLQPSDAGLRVPNMGWRDVTASRPSPVWPVDDARFEPEERSRPFYFAHSFHLECADPADVVATIDYGGSVVASVQHGDVYGVQFHPEKSQDAGLDLLDAFVRLSLLAAC